MSVTVEQIRVPCWEQALSTTEVLKYEKRGISVNTKVYFTTDPAVTDRHDIVITKRNGVAVPAASQKILRGLLPAQPDAGAGLGVLYRVIGNDIPGADT